jgi:hypothetical protein
MMRAARMAFPFALLLAIAGCTADRYGEGGLGGIDLTQNDRLFREAREACIAKAADRDYEVERVGDQERVSPKRVQVRMELQQDRQLYHALCVYNAESRRARLEDVDEAGAVEGADPDLARARRVCEREAEEEGAEVLRIGRGEALGGTRYKVELRIQDPDDADDPDRIECIFDARSGRVDFKT